MLPNFKVKVGKEPVEFRHIVANMHVARYKGQEIFLNYQIVDGQLEWTWRSNVDEKTVDKVIDAIEKHLKGSKKAR